MSGATYGLLALTTAIFIGAASVSRIYSLTRLSSAGELNGLNMRTPRDFKVMPYGSGSASRNYLDSTQLDFNGQAEFGVDAKFGVTSSTTLDATYNTDFAQVEVDEQQVNLTRFNLLFPEKRPFFLENRGLFAVGKNGEIDLFFSRRIGITDNGALVPIRGGARLTGKSAGLNIGLLDMQTDNVGPTPANNFLTARVSKDLQNRSSVGAIFVSRNATGATLSACRTAAWRVTCISIRPEFPATSVASTVKVLGPSCSGTCGTSHCPLLTMAA